MPYYDEQQLAELLRALRPPPAEWIEAARETPRIQRQLDEVLPTLEQDASLRAAETAELERALEAAGVEPTPELVAAAKRRLQASGS